MKSKFHGEQNKEKHTQKTSWLKQMVISIGKNFALNLWVVMGAKNSHTWKAEPTETNMRPVWTAWHIQDQLK